MKSDISQRGTIVCRFAPSPTGPLHVGSVRSALFNYLYARQHGGKLLLRIEDTDKERSRPEYEKEILDGFEWLGLSFDHTERQSDRMLAHKKILEELVSKNLAYVSKEEPSSEEGRRSEVVRFKNPNERVVFNDLIKGKIEFDTTELGDFVIAKSMTEPLFHLAVVADDIAMSVTHIIRGEDHISNTPRQILIQRALGATEPVYAHIPLLLSSDRSKLSKRKHGDSVSLSFYRRQGYLPEAILNYLALLGWNPGDDRELFTLQELVKEFTLEKVQKGGAIFNPEKLNWMNKHYLAKRPRETVLKEISEILLENPALTNLSKTGLGRLSEVILERVSYYGEIRSLLLQGEFDYLKAVTPYKKESLLWAKDPDQNKTRGHIEEIVNLLKEMPENVDAQEVKGVIFPYAEKHGKGNILWPVRFALSGRERSMDPFNLIGVLGKSESLHRLRMAVEMLQ